MLNGESRAASCGLHVPWPLRIRIARRRRASFSVPAVSFSRSGAGLRFTVFASSIPQLRTTQGLLAGSRLAPQLASARSSPTNPKFIEVAELLLEKLLAEDPDRPLVEVDVKLIRSLNALSQGHLRFGLQLEPFVVLCVGAGHSGGQVYLVVPQLHARQSQKQLDGRVVRLVDSDDEEF